MADDSCEQAHKNLQNAEENEAKAAAAEQSARDAYQSLVYGYGRNESISLLGFAFGVGTGGTLAKMITATAAGGAGAATSEADFDARYPRVRKAYLDAKRAHEAAQKAVDKAFAQVMKECYDQPSRGGCGSRGGPGYRRADGKCGGWNDWGSDDCGD